MVQFNAIDFSIHQYTVQGSFLEFASANGDIYITPKGVPSGQQPAVLVMSDIDTCAGLVHTVSQVLVPEGEEVERIGELDAKDEGTGKPVCRYLLFFLPEPCHLTCIACERN